MRKLTEFALDQEKKLRRKNSPMLPWQLGTVALALGIACTFWIDIQIPRYEHALKIIRQFMCLDLAIIFALFALCLAAKIKTTRLWIGIWLLLAFAFGQRIATPYQIPIPKNNEGYTYAIIKVQSLTTPVENKNAVIIKLLYTSDNHMKFKYDGRNARLALKNGEFAGYGQKYLAKLKIFHPQPPEIQ